MSRHWTKWKWAVASGLLASVSALGQHKPAEANANPLGHSPQAIEQGREIFNRTCAVCHGLNGAGTDRGPGLGTGRDHARRKDAAIFDAVQHGIPGTNMPALGLQEMDIWKVVAFIRSLRATASEAAVPGDVAHGEQIFQGKGRCTECHMIRGRGGILGPDLTNIGGTEPLSAIRDALTKAKAQIPRGYQPVEVVTADGRKISGIAKNNDNFSLQLLDNAGHLDLFTLDELRHVTYKKQSLMPSDLDKTLTAAELQDLLAFLSRQAIEGTKPAEESDEEQP
ncbi:MAG TPA: c-type cytochrome [Bryobacteraceae bacterium]|nr:c-type cytochrome [Bryobacteraceae bacterium]